MSAPTHVERIDLPKRAADIYEDFPDDPELSGFDRSDRKFVALARRESVPVANATDSDWLHHHAILERHGIAVHFVCGSNNRDWFAS